MFFVCLGVVNYSLTLTRLAIQSLTPTPHVLTMLCNALCGSVSNLYHKEVQSYYSCPLFPYRAFSCFVSSVAQYVFCDVLHVFLLIWLKCYTLSIDNLFVLCSIFVEIHLYSSYRRFIF